jgi:hypothetical protein
MSAQIMRDIYYQKAMDGGVAIGSGRRRHCDKYVTGPKGKTVCQKYIKNAPGTYTVSHYQGKGKKIQTENVNKAQYNAKHNPWIIHVKKFHRAHPDLTYGEALHYAAKTYIKDKPKAPRRPAPKMPPLPKAPKRKPKALPRRPVRRDQGVEYY